MEYNVKENQECEKTYKESIEKFNNFLDCYYMQLVYLIFFLGWGNFYWKNETHDAFELQECERLEALKKSVNSFYILEISSLNEFVYDIELGSKVWKELID